MFLVKPTCKKGMMSIHAALICALSIQLVEAYIPTVSGTPQVLGLVQDPTINRDSCGSSRFGSRAFWTCRDSQPFDSNGVPTLPVYSSSASWTDFNSDGTPELQSISGYGTGLLMYGNNNEQPFYPILADECNDNTAGSCSDGTRWAIWPDSPPLVTSEGSDGSIVAYTWIKQSHITSSLGVENPDPPVTLYRVNYDPSTAGSSGLPTVTTVQENFWESTDFPYGPYGGVVSNGYAYIYGQNAAGSVALAKVPVDSVEDKSAYQYYIDETYITSNPGVNASGINIPNVSAGGQGTFYYSSVWSLFVWIGQASDSVSADFYVTTSPSPEGPWDTPTHFYSATNGNYFLGAYSLQAHPDLLSSSSENAIYLTYTKNDYTNNANYYTTPLILVQWE